MRISRAVVATGGTGGHIFPALAVAEALRARSGGAEVLFLGGSGPEGDLARAAGLAFRSLPAQGVLGRGMGALAAPFWIAAGLVLALIALVRFRPEVVIGFGGYASFCPILAAWVLGVPAALHEQNSVPGRVNRILGRLVKRVFLSFEDVSGAFSPAKTRLTGNPVRPGIAAVGEEPKTFGRSLLVVGGSQGARAINQAMIEAAPALVAAGVGIVHQTGPADLSRVREEYSRRGLSPDSARGFIKDMAGAFRGADLILCRAGATTVFEVAAAARPALLVPFPHATNDHQRENARRYASTGAALVLDQAELTGERLARAVLELLDAPEKLSAMARAAQGFARPEAADLMLEELFAMLEPPSRRN